MKKLLALLLAVTMLLSLVACGTAGGEGEKGGKVEHEAADENTPDFFDGRDLGDLSGDFHISAKRQPAQSVVGLAVLRLIFEDSEPRVEEEVKFLHPHLERASGNEVSELMYYDEQ